ncbi:MAG: hypothetical protein KatS3mg131_3733 [Candidatus Tectimicrobiota bacterium]|nr:MAG: hypothetical protein KatS3mg131_3733 [Candidatus Tectomicrobia bacterium]
MEADPLWEEVVLIAVAVVLSGGFEAIEVALLSAQKGRLREWENAGRAGAAAALRIREAPEPYLATVRMATTFLSVFAAVLAGAVAVRFLTPWTMAHLSLPAAWAFNFALAVAIAVLAYVTLIAGQLVPKAFALQHPERILCGTARLLMGLRRLFGPVQALLDASLTLVLWLLGQRRPPESVSITAITEEAVTTMVREGAERGIFEEVEHELIEGVFEFADTAVREIMVPRVRIQALEVNTPPEEVVRKMSEIGHSRVPVYSGDLDHIVGVLYFKDVLRVLGEGKPWEVRSLLHPPLFVPETVQLSRLLRMLQQRRLNMAIVVDEHGGVAGLVTIEDILEELVGEIRDEG